MAAAYTHVERLADSQFSHQCQLGEFTSDLHGCGRPCTWSRVPITWVRLSTGITTDIDGEREARPRRILVRTSIRQSADDAQNF